MAKGGTHNAATKLFEYVEDGLFNELKTYFSEHSTKIRNFLTMTGVYDRNLLHVACSKGQTDIVKFLMEHLEKEHLLSTIDTFDQYRNSALYLCCVQGIPDEDGGDAQESQRAEIVKLLKSKGSQRFSYAESNLGVDRCFDNAVQREE